jgi:hypothetical protein
VSKNLVAGLVVAALVAAGGWLAARTFGTTGQEAIDRMSPEERAFLVKLQSLRQGMSLEQVVDTLGPPDDKGPLQMRPRWNVGGNPLNGVAIYILSNGAHHFTWISIGRFTYEEPLRPDAPPRRSSRSLAAAVGRAQAS